MKHIAGFFAALIIAALGVYVLWQFKTGYGLGFGGFCVFLSLGIAFPTQLGQGITTLKVNVTVIAPALKDAFLGTRAGDQSVTVEKPKDGAP